MNRCVVVSLESLIATAPTVSPPPSLDVQPKRLPTARIIPASAPLVPPNTLQQRLTPLLFESSRLLSIVPAVRGTLYNLYLVYDPPTTPFPDGRRRPERIDYLVSALWVQYFRFQTHRPAVPR
jgi:hypothetical protein